MIKNIFKPLNNNLNSLLPIRFHNVSLKLGNNYFFNKLSFLNYLIIFVMKTY